LALCGIVLFGWMFGFSYGNAAGFFPPIGAVSPGVTVGLLVAGAAAVTLLAAYWASRRLRTAAYVGLLLLLTISIRLVWVFLVPTLPVSDFQDMYAGALEAASGNAAFGHNEYFTRWVYQFGFTMYEALVIKLFGPQLIALKLFNVLFQAGTALLVYRSAALAFNETSGRIAGLLYAVYVPHIMMGSVLTNQHISTFFFTLAFYLLIRRRFTGAYVWLAVGLCLGIGHLMRPLGSFFVVGFVAYVVLFRLVPAIREREWAALAVRTAGVLAVFWIVQHGASAALTQSGIAEHPLGNREPYWKFMVGLNPETNGGWSYEDDMYALRYPAGEERNQAELALLKERLKNGSEVAELFVRKAKAMWGDEDSAPLWSLYGVDGEGLKPLLTRIERIEYVLMALFGLIAMTVIAFRGGSSEACLYLLLLLGYAALHIVIEIQTRYRFDIFPCIFVLQSFGAAAVLEAIRKRKSRAARSGEGVLSK
jgi:4-amino-4-deoxy-L-arabinose transferase-like glycosyltransferase